MLRRKKRKKKSFWLQLTIRINIYVLIGVGKCLLAALSWQKGEKLAIDKNADGSATLRKA